MHVQRGDNVPEGEQAQVEPVEQDPIQVASLTKLLLLTVKMIPSITKKHWKMWMYRSGKKPWTVKWNLCIPIQSGLL